VRSRPAVKVAVFKVAVYKVVDPNPVAIVKAAVSSEI